MLVNLVFFLLICSGSVFCAVKYERKFEETLPVTAMGFILLIFVCGIFGFLKAGVALCFLIALFLYTCSAVLIYKKKAATCLFPNLVTPGLAVFIGAFFVLSYTEYGHYCFNYDEFSHWADIVKIMTHLDDFGTNPASYALFPFYPPGMAIFQYIFQKIGHALGTVSFFSEWHLFFAFKIFIVILMLPFFSELSFRNVHHILLLTVTVFVAPLFMTRFMYRDIYIDPIMGLLSGVGMASILLCRKKDWLYALRIWLICASLVLFKDVGKLFAAFLLAAYCVDTVLDSEQGTGKKKLGLILAGTAFTLVPMLLWKWEVVSSQCTVRFSGKIDVAEFLQILMGRSDSYRAQVLVNYLEKLNFRQFTIGHLPIELSYYAMLLLLLVLSGGLCWLYVRKEPEKSRAKAIVVGIAIAQMIVYMVGLVATYMYKFNETEALSLAAMERYVQMALLANWVIIIMLISFAAIRWGKRALCILLMAGFLLTSPVKELYNVAAKKYDETSWNDRPRMEALREKTGQFCAGDDKILFVCEGDPDIYAVMFQFNARPAILVESSQLYYDGENNHLESLRNTIEGCDYVAIFKINDTFSQFYGELFEDPADIEVDALYAVDKTSGLLVKCE